MAHPALHGGDSSLAIYPIRGVEWAGARYPHLISK